MSSKPCCLTTKFYDVCLQLRKQNYAYNNEYKNYCQICLKRFQRSLLARLRLQVEVGRYCNIP